MSDNFLKCTPPTPSKYLSRKSVITAIGIFGFLLALAIIIGKNRHELKKTDTSSLKSYPSNSLNMLALKKLSARLLEQWSPGSNGKSYLDGSSEVEKLVA